MVEIAGEEEGVSLSSICSYLKVFHKRKRRTEFFLSGLNGKLLNNKVGVTVK